ncbi:glutamate racemase [Alteribacillus persepolensis]|uniref:Glutamate racemase n=1 Tax=Alteribacillus persepolensis TaxID=568899 RepID=A0A1G8BPV7_9BACI|nr:glutamate racemase [Alteribacillus persepolensis]SDH35078.1 glutamate racemase [Alteribacillus persepolensis]
MNQPIGIIDSGVGGLTVAREIARQLPKEEMIYIGDTARCPYGPRPVEEVKSFTWEMIHHLLEENIKMLVIACNTATAVVLEEVQQELSIPVVGVVQPGAITALKVTTNNHIAVIGTEGTIASGAYVKALHTINENVTVDSLACPPFVPLVEQGICEGEEALAIVQQTLRPLWSKPFDTLILGCTHYPLLYDVIQTAVGDDIALISSGDETAREVSTILHYKGMLTTNHHKPHHTFCTTGSAERFQRIANRWLDTRTNNVQSIHLAAVQ